MHYNEALADKQGLSDEEREALDGTYEALLYAFEHPEEFEDIERTVRDFEFQLQKLWKFPQDPKFHRYQQHIRGCTCPVMDNLELVGYDEHRYRISDCPWHWKEEDK